jgi:hypothetical protein
VSNFLVWESDVDPPFCTLTTIGGVERDWELQRGVSRRKGFPADAEFSMNPDFPRDRKLADNIPNGSQLVVVSRAVKETVEAAQPPKVEYLPVRIIDHKGRLAADDYLIVNPFDPQECIDLERSDLMWNAIEPDLICGCYKLVLDETKIAEGTKIFMAKHLPATVFIHRELADTLTDAGFSGVDFVELDEYMR